MSKDEAVEGAKHGDGECLEFLYKLHKRRVYSVCLRMIGDVEAAEDLTQEATYLTSMRMVGMLHDPHHII
jgi:RNA polymerase sigma-70 factor (ECF subfamily)